MASPLCVEEGGEPPMVPEIRGAVPLNAIPISGHRSLNGRAARSA